MSDEFEMMIEDVFVSEEFFPDDDLTSIIRQDSASELAIEDLDYVAAAQKNNYQQFLRYLETNYG